MPPFDGIKYCAIKPTDFKMKLGNFKTIELSTDMDFRDEERLFSINLIYSTTIIYLGTNKGRLFPIDYTVGKPQTTMNLYRG